MMEVSMAKPVALSHPADRCDVLEAIALVLRACALADPFEDLAAWVAGVEVIEGLKRAGFTVVRSAPSSPVIHRTTGARGAVQ